MSRIRVGFILAVVGLALAGASYFIWQRWFRPPLPVIPKLSISKYGTIIGITDSVSGRDLTGGNPIGDGYSFTYKVETSPGVWEEKFFSVVAESATGTPSNAVLKDMANSYSGYSYIPNTISAVVYLLDGPADQRKFLKVVSSFWVNPANGEILISRAVVPGPDAFGKFADIEAVETNSNNKVLVSKSSKKTELDSASMGVLDRSCWPCSDDNDPQKGNTPLCAATLRGEPAQEYYVCLNCYTTEDGAPRPIIASSERAIADAERGSFCTNRKIFLYGDGELGLGVPRGLGERRVLICASCDRMATLRGVAVPNAYAVHAKVGEGISLSSLSEECIYLIRHDHWDILGKEIGPFAIIETRTIAPTIRALP